VAYLRHGSALLLGVTGPLTLANALGGELRRQLESLGLPAVPFRVRCWSIPTLWLGYRVHQPRGRYLVRRGGAAGERAANPYQAPLRRVVQRLRLRLPVAALGA